MDPDLSLVGFDLDDTLYDHSQYVKAGFRAAANYVEERTGQDIYEDLVTTYYDDGEYHQTFDVVLEARDISLDFVPEMVERHHDVIGALDPRPKVESVLSELRATYDLALVTDGKNAPEKLDRLGLAGYFDPIIVTREMDTSKADVEPFLGLLEASSVSADEVVYVGDNPRVDFTHPNRLGMKTVWLRAGLHGDREPAEESEPDVEIETFTQLRDLLLESP
jgi:putative hydrolase of the HAD superfamily